MKAATPVLVVLAAVCAGALGYFVGLQHGSAKSPPAAGEGASAEVARLRSENERLKEETRSTQTSNAAMAANAGRDPAASGARESGTETPLHRLRIVSEIQKQKLASVRLPVLGRDGTLTNEFARLFDLSAQERSTLQQAVENARQKIDTLAMASATVAQEGDALVARLKPFEGGADVYDSVMDAFAQTLGPERNAALVPLITDQFTNAFHGFGAQQRTITLSREIMGSAGEPRLVLRDERRGAAGTGSSMTSGQTDPDQLVRQYPWLTPHLDAIAKLPVRRRAPLDTPK
jgi:hypothetical protein